MISHFDRTPLVAVVLAVPVGSRAVDRAIASVLRQSEESWELIVVINGLDDGTRARLRNWESRDERIRVFAANPGVCRAAMLNLGLRHATGAMVAYLDPGDEYYPDYLERVARLGEQGDVLIFSYDFVAEGNDSGPEVGFWDSCAQRDLLFVNRPAILLGIAHPRELWGRVGGFDESLQDDDDWDFCKRLAHAGAAFLYLPLRSGLYHIHHAASRIVESQAIRSASPAQPAPAEMPTRFGDYRVIRVIGRGSMGVVYQAVRPGGGRHVALKVLHLDRQMITGEVDRFWNEARIAGRLDHANIIPVIDVGERSGIPCFTMPLIRGRGLDEVLAEFGRLHLGGSARRVGLGAALARGIQAGRFSRPARVSPAVGVTSSLLYREVAHLGLQAADGLSHAHERGVLHRDVKPANLILDPRGVVRIADFGLARDDALPRPTSVDPIVGTPKFRAPEQSRGYTDPRSDLYGLAATLYQFVIFCRFTREIPPDLELTLLRAMSHDPDDRQPTVRHFAAELSHFLAES